MYSEKSDSKRKKINRNYWLYIIILIFTACTRPAEPAFDNPYDEQSSAFIPHPGVNTLEVENVTAVSAIAGGDFSGDYGYPVSEKGVCWGISQNPSISDDCTTEGSGNSSFTSELNELSPDTRYYIRAYATNQAGTEYGEQREFTTRDGVVQLSTSEVSSITMNSARSGGNISNDGGADITERGVCWSTSQNPTTSDNCSSDGMGTGGFTSDISNLNVSTTYYVRAYATNAAGTFYGNNRQFTTATHGPIVFEDHFTNNNKDWADFEDAEGFARIRDGKYHLRFLRSGFYRRSTNSISNYIFEDNFSLEMALKVNEVLDDIGYFGFEWNSYFGESGATHRHFHFSNDGWTLIADMIEEEWKNYIEWMNTGMRFFPGENITLKIRKSGSEYQVTINGNSAGTITFNHPDLPFTNVFAIIYGDIDISVDYIRITDHSGQSKIFQGIKTGNKQDRGFDRFDIVPQESISPFLFKDSDEH